MPAGMAVRCALQVLGLPVVLALSKTGRPLWPWSRLLAYPVSIHRCVRRGRREAGSSREERASFVPFRGVRTRSTRRDWDLCARFGGDI